MPDLELQPVSPGLRPEATLLLLACGTLPEEQKASRTLRLVDPDFDWAWLLETADRGRVIPMLYVHLKTHCEGAIPENLRHRLHQSFQKSTVRNLHMTRELLQILETFSTRAIDCIPYKGPILAGDLYGNPSLREYWDLDVIIRPQDLGRAKAILIDRGYKPEKMVSEAEEKALIETDSEYNFDRASDDSHVEVHWQVLPRSHARGYDSDYLWGHAVPGIFAGQKVLKLPPEELFLILCIHGGDKHDWSRLKWLCDVAWLIARTPDLKWERIMEQAAGFGRLGTVRLAIYLARILLDAPVPKAVFEKGAEGAQLRALAGLARGRIFNRESALPGFREWADYVNAADEAAGTTHNKTERWRYLRAVMTPTWEDREARPLKEIWDPLYYVLRPARLLKLHGFSGLMERLR